MTAARRAALALLFVAGGAAALLAHRSLSASDSPASGIVFAAIPLVVIVSMLARRVGHGAALVLLAMLGASAWWVGLGGLERHAADLFFVEHAGMMLALAWLFGRTLRHGVEPLCSRFARLVHGSIDAATEMYTRRLTWTWTVFFALVFVSSCTLYALHLRGAWSLLANVLTPLLVGVLFIVEYAVRGRALPHNERVGFLAAVHAFRRHMAGTEAPH